MRISLHINGKPVAAEIPPRVHLADFLREDLLLTGTHLGCEHGVCGACTIMMDGAPARSCIAYAAACDGAHIETIEGLEDDLVMTRLRAAFTRSHALQCGYCTPGMLVTARDIVRRLPDADDDRIRLELAGNLCRCTGYNGIVRAIRTVLDERLDVSALPSAPLPRRTFAQPAPQAAVAPVRAKQAGLDLRVAFALPVETVWSALRDPSLIALCIPGAVLTQIDGDRLTGEMTVSLGPIRARFSGTARVSYDDAEHSGRIEGEGRDRGSTTRLTGAAQFKLQPDNQGCLLELGIEYSLQGPLAQLARGPIVEAVAAELVDTVGANLQARLRGRAVGKRRMGAFGLLLRAMWRQLRKKRRK